MASRRVRLGDVPLWGRFRRVGDMPGWCVRVTEHDYCEEEDAEDARAAVARFPSRPGHEMYVDVGHLADLAAGPTDDFWFLTLWNRFYAFRDRDFARADKKDFLVPTETP